jgi:glycerol-3-phosphate dehydrogenase (NAD(P)+)
MKVAILGCGAYGLALASILVKNKVNVTMWSYSNEEKEILTKSRKSNKLENYKIPECINFSTDMNEVVKDCNLIVIAVPTFSFESTVIKLKECIDKRQSVLIATKGIQQDTCLFLHDVFKKHCKNKIAVISGPSFAVDIIHEVPIGLSLATKHNSVDLLVKKCFENELTKFRRTNDIIGVEVCGSIKNVMAIASGMLEGMNAAPSTKALFLTESMNDIKELLFALGGKKKTILSFAGFGDILMTSTSPSSRNFSFGCLIGKGKSKQVIDNYLKETTVEGMYTLQSIHKLVKKKNVKMPIINLIYDIINGTKEKEEILSFLINK